MILLETGRTAPAPNDIISVSKAVIQGHMEAGLLPVIKHIPGHGRATADSHEALPVIKTDIKTLRENDFVPFKALKDMPLGMTGHLLLDCLDSNNPVSTSKKIISEVIREEIGFDGLLMSDDLSMKALDGSMQKRAEQTLQAGCDIALHCNGEIAEMRQVAEVSPVLEGDRLRRIIAAKRQFRVPKPIENQEIHTLLEELLAKMA